MLDDDRLAPVDDTDRLHPQSAARSGLDGAHRDLQGAVRHLTIECLPYFLYLNPQSVGDQSDLSLPFTRDGAWHADPWLVREGPAESHRLAHDVGNPVVVVQGDFVCVDLLDR